MKHKVLITVILLITTIFFGACSSDEDVAVTGLSLSKTSITLLKGEEDSIVARIAPENASNQSVTWSSSAPSNVSVTNGKIHALAAGSATITATTVDGQFTASCQVTVQVNVSGVSLSQTELTIVKGKSTSLSCTVAPADATDKQVIWSSSDNTVATVDQDGTVTGMTGGVATITVATPDGKFKASCTVTVIVPVSGISLDKSSLELIVGEEETLSATVLPEDASEKGVTWSSSNPSVVFVEDGKVKGLTEGSAIITTTSVDGALTATCTIRVKKANNIDYNPYGDGEKW